MKGVGGGTMVYVRLDGGPTEERALKDIPRQAALEVWDGHAFRKARIMRSASVSLFRLQLKSGHFVDATQGQKFVVREGSRPPRWAALSDIRAGMEVALMGGPERGGTTTWSAVRFNDFPASPRVGDAYDLEVLSEGREYLVNEVRMRANNG